MRFHRNPHRLDGRRFMQFRQQIILRESLVINGLNVRVDLIAGGGGAGGGGVPASASQLQPPRNTSGEAGQPGQNQFMSIYLPLRAVVSMGGGGDTAAYSLTPVPGTNAMYTAPSGFSGGTTSITFTNGTLWSSAVGGNPGRGAWQDWWPSSPIKESAWQSVPGIVDYGAGGYGVPGGSAQFPPASSRGGDGVVVITYGR